MLSTSAATASIYRTKRVVSRWALALAAGLAFGAASSARATILLNDSLADGTRTSANLPSESPIYVGISNGNGGSATTSVGKLAFVEGTGSQRLWTYFTSDNSVPNGSQPHNAVTTLTTGQVLTVAITFTIPSSATIAGSPSTTSRDFRFGIFFDPTDPRVQTDVSSDGGGTGNPWQDSTGYAVTIPINSQLTTSTNELQISKRTTNNTSLLGSSSALTTASSGGSVFAWQTNTSYTVQLSMTDVSASEVDVTSSILSGSTLLSTVTDVDAGTTFGGVSTTSGNLTGATSPYTKFDQMFFRMGSQEATEFDFTNFSAVLTPVPEPASIGLVGIGLSFALMRMRRPAKA
jgi:hypothetical protein